MTTRDWVAINGPKPSTWTMKIAPEPIPNGKKILIAVPTCEETAARRKACEETWASTKLAEVRFFTSEDLGVPITAESSRLKTDELGFVNRPGQALSVRQTYLCRWALERNYDFVFKCDDDTYVWVDRLLHSGFANHDYSGYAQDWHNPPFASGGAGYWLSRKAMLVIANATRWMDPEDVWVATTLHSARIFLHGDVRYRWNLPPIITNDLISVHYVKDPALMHKIHNGVL